MASTSFQWDASKQQTVTWLLDILQNPGYQLHRSRIATALKDLGKYDPATFDRVFEDPIYRQNLIQALQGLIDRWTQYNPVITSDVRDFDTYKALYLSIHRRDQDAISDLIQKLNFSQTVTHSLAQDPLFRSQTLEILYDKITRWQRTHPWLSLVELPTPAEGADIEAFSNDLNRHYILSEFRQELDTPRGDIKSLRYNALMANPQSIAAAEKTLGLKVTGDKDQLIKNYKSNYYTRDCTIYNTSQKCLELMAKTGTFQQAYEFLLGRISHSSMYSAKVFIGELATRGQRYDVITAVADKYKENSADPELLTQLSFIIAAQAAQDQQFDIYQTYFHQAIDTLPPLGAEVNRRIIDINTSFYDILRGAARSDSQEMVKLVSQDIEDLLASGFFPINSMIMRSGSTSTVLSQVAAERGDVSMLRYLREIGRFNMDYAIHGAIGGCNPDVIQYLKPDIIDKFLRKPIILTALRELVDKAVMNNCAAVLELCINESGGSPEVIDGYLGKRNILLENKNPEFLDLIFANYLDLLDASGGADVLLKNVIARGDTPVLDVMMKYPIFRHKLTGLERFIHDGKIGAYNLDKIYKITKYAIDKGYTVPKDGFKDLLSAVISKDPGVVKALVEYYVENNAVISRDMYQRIRSVLSDVYTLDVMKMYFTPRNPQIPNTDPYAIKVMNESLALLGTLVATE